MTTGCCAECGKEEGDGGASLKICKPCMQVKYCNTECQHKHWATHKAACKLRAAELRDEVLFKDPPPKEECPICFLPMPINLVCCVSLPPATISSVPVSDYALANEELANMEMEEFNPCCGKSICRGCIHSFRKSGTRKCPFCNTDRCSKTEEEDNEDLMNRAAVNDAASINLLADSYYQGLYGLQRDRAKAIELYARAAEVGYSKAHSSLGVIYEGEGDLKKAKLHYEATMTT